MDVKNVTCVSCGAPLQVSPNAEYVDCAYCGMRLAVERGEKHPALKTAEEVGKKLQKVGDKTQEAIRASTYVTQIELKRLQLAQELYAAQMHLSGIQAEIRSLERLKQNRKIKQQLRELTHQEQAAIQRIGNLQAANASMAETGWVRDMAHVPVGIATGAAVIPSHAKDWTTALALCLLFGWLGVHRFYSGHTLIGVIQLVTFGGFGL